MSNATSAVFIKLFTQGALRVVYSISRSVQSSNAPGIDQAGMNIISLKHLIKKLLSSPYKTDYCEQFKTK